MKYVVALVAMAIALLVFGLLRYSRIKDAPALTSSPKEVARVPQAELAPARAPESPTPATSPTDLEDDCASDDELEPLPRELSRVELMQLLGPKDLVDEQALDDALEMVTPVGLFDRTAGWWDQPDFLALTGDELAALLPASDGYAFGGERTLLDFVGPLPTIEDCERAFDDPGVLRELIRVALIELPVNKLGLTPLDERDEKWLADFATLLDRQRAAELDLCRELERATGFAHWSVICRAFGAWNQ